jgi:Na+/serine symporter
MGIGDSRSRNDNDDVEIDDRGWAHAQALLVSPARRRAEIATLALASAVGGPLFVWCLRAVGVAALALGPILAAALVAAWCACRSGRRAAVRPFWIALLVSTFSTAVVSIVLLYRALSNLTF